MRVSRSSVRGEQAVLNFISAAYKRGLLITKPVTVDVGYDLIIHNPRTQEMWRVQVKTAYREKGGSYLASLHRKRGRYTPGLVHRFAFERPDQSGFWILDAKEVEHGSGGRPKDRYWERWDLFGVKG